MISLEGSSVVAGGEELSGRMSARLAQVWERKMEKTQGPGHADRQRGHITHFALSPKSNREPPEGSKWLGQAWLCCFGSTFWLQPGGGTDSGQASAPIQMCHDDNLSEEVWLGLVQVGAWEVEFVGLGVCYIRLRWRSCSNADASSRHPEFLLIQQAGEWPLQSQSLNNGGGMSLLDKMQTLTFQHRVWGVCRLTRAGGPGACTKPASPKGECLESAGLCLCLSRMLYQSRHPWSHRC